MSTPNAYEEVIRNVEQTGLYISREVHGLTTLNRDMVFPHLVIFYCHQGKARAMYDMREMTQTKNDLSILMPGHVLRQLECSDDFVFTRIVVSSELFADLRTAVFSHDYDKFHHHPSFRLTDEQARRLLMVTDVLSVIVAHDSRDLKLRQQLMLYQLAIGYEFLNYYRREMDTLWPNNRQLDIFNRFCELVVAHYKESREVQFYARQLDLTPKYFSQVIRSATNGISPGQWIEQYIATQTKRLIQTRPEVSLKEIAYEMGFNEPSSFYRYFKRATGMTAKEFKES